jgi:hypothetical protein
MSISSGSPSPDYKVVVFIRLQQFCDWLALYVVTGTLA